MQKIIDFWFSTEYWPPRWHCGEWSDWLGWLHITSDTLIALAYFTIPVVLVLSCFKVKGIKLEHIFILFALFIFFCGTGHLIEAIIFYQPIYRFDGLWKALTALISWITVFALIPYARKMAQFPQLKVINQELMDTLQFERERLRTALKESHETQKNLKEFSYRVAHDLKTPVRGVYSYSTMLLDGDDSLKGSIREDVEKMQKLSEQSMRMIDDILHFATAEFKSRVKSNINLNRMLDDVLLEIPDPESQFWINVAKDIPDIQGNEVTIKELFRNLIMNGLRHNESEIKRVDVGFEEKDDEVIYFVKDNGIGMSSEVIENLFEYSRVHKVFSKNSDTGFGLMIIKKAVDQHGGRIWVESEEGKGSTFFFTFNTESVLESVE